MMTLRWHKKAQEQFSDIFKYYKDVANLSSAKKVTQKLKTRAYLLKTNPELGLIEPLLCGRSHIYRALSQINIRSFIILKVNRCILL